MEVKEGALPHLKKNHLLWTCTLSPSHKLKHTWGTHGSSLTMQVKTMSMGRPGGSAVERLPSAQGVILGPGIESRLGLPAWSLLLPLPVCLPLSQSVSLMNK